MEVKIIRKDLMPKYYICEYNEKTVVLHENLLNIEKLLPVTISKRTVDLTNKDINNWHVLFYIGERKWLCRCSCGRYCAVTGYNLSYNKSLSCGHERIDDLTGRKFGDWTVIRYSGVDNGMTQWECECSCGNKKIVYASRLLNGRSKSCGHDTNAFKDYTGEKFGEWTVIKYIGNRMWHCECSCGNTGNIDISSLTRGMSKSCGHLTSKLRTSTMMERYGETASNKLRDKREQWQIDVVSSKERLYNYIINNHTVPTTALKLSEELGINTYNIYRKIHAYNLDNLIQIDYNSSKYEDEISLLIESLGLNVNKRFKLSNGQEIDIYIPEKKIGIEFNGSYWHSEIYKNNRYHQEKTLYCDNMGIRLIQIFEHEWRDAKSKIKIVSLIYNILNTNTEAIGARKTYIKEITSEESAQFLDAYHLQNNINARINLGCYSKETNTLLGVMTFGKPRFNTKYDYEMYRMCWRGGICVIGGTAKLFKYFLNNYSPLSVISYVDMSKFSGNSYIKIGMHLNSVTEPGYGWYNCNTREYIPRYKTQKHKLVANKLGTDDETEDTIMYRLGYVKIYNCGNKVMIWEDNNGSKSTNTLEW